MSVLSSATDVPPPGAAWRLPPPAPDRLPLPIGRSAGAVRRCCRWSSWASSSPWPARSSSASWASTPHTPAACRIRRPARELRPSSEGSRVVSADGVELATFAAEQREVVPYDEIPQLLIDAQVAAEDQTFWTNPCIDFRGIVRAALQNLTAGETGVRRLDHLPAAGPHPPLRRRPDGRPRPAVRAEDQGVRSWPCGSASAMPATRASRRILEMYMNQVYYGNKPTASRPRRRPTSARTSPPTTPTTS